MDKFFENSLFSNKYKDIDSQFRRIYFGNEFCENLIPGLDELKRWYDASIRNKKHFTFVTPFVTNRGLYALENRFAFLNMQKNIEVVFNDWGVLSRIKDNFKNLIPVAGRLLTKQRRDPRILRILTGKQKPAIVASDDKKSKIISLPKKPPASLFRHFSASLINVPIFQNFLLAQGIRRIEIDNLAWPMEVRVDKKIKISIYLPYGYISTSRLCGKMTLSYASCKKECKKYFFSLKNPLSPVPISAIGNTVFYETTVSSFAYLKSLGVDRIVFQNKLPF